MCEEWYRDILLIPYGPKRRLAISLYKGELLRMGKSTGWYGWRFMFYPERKIYDEWTFRHWRFLTIPIRRIANT